MTKKRFVEHYAGRTLKRLIGIKDIETNRVCVTIEENTRLLNELNDVREQLIDENKQLKKELTVYRKVARCSNCKYQNYDWFEDGDEFEICEKGNNNQQMEYHICKEWEEF